jgi:glutaredoxin 3
MKIAARSMLGRAELVTARDMPPITIYTKATCPYCIAAKALLRRKNAPFTEISVDGDPAGQAAMAERAHGRWTVPQIFIGERHVGGSDDLHALEAAGKLDSLLSG